MNAICGDLNSRRSFLTIVTSDEEPELEVIGGWFLNKT